MNEIVICPAVGGANVVFVRDRDPGPGRTVYLNRTDKRRAYINVRTISNLPDVAGITRAVTELRALWGDMLLHDDSGACAHLVVGATTPNAAAARATISPARSRR